MVSYNAAAAMPIPEYGLQRGAPANFIALQARHVPEAAVGRPPERSVYRSGELIARGGKLLPERNSMVV
jgi:cytosine/creatinine deaminase